MQLSKGIPSSKYDWVNKKYLNKGAFAEVFKVFYQISKDFVAVKMLIKSKFPSKDTLFLIKKQISIHQQLKHPNIVKLIQNYDTEDYCFVTMQLCEGSLRDFMQFKKYNLPFEQACNIFKQLAQGVKEIVNKKIVHRDVKPENVLFKAGCFKVSDFGFATKFNESLSGKMTFFCGTPLYMSPQILQSLAYTSKCDIWSWGLLFYQMLFGRTPWPCRDQKSYLNNIKTMQVTFPYDKPISQSAKDLISKCLVYSEERRIGWQQFFNHRFFSQIPQKATKQKLSSSLVDCLRSLSKQIMEKAINIKNIYQQFKSKTGMKQLNFQAFSFFVKKINPQFTEVQIRQMFTAFDKDKMGTIDLNQMVELLRKYDFQPIEDKAARILLEIKHIIKNNNLDVKKLFSKIDKDKSGSINQQEFFGFIRYVAPKMRRYDSDQIFKLIDVDKSKSIEVAQFIKALSPVSLGEQGKMILFSLKRTMIYYKLPVDKLMQQFDRDNNGLDTAQLTQLVRMIEPFTKDKQIQDLFSFMGGAPGVNVRKENLISALKSV